MKSFFALLVGILFLSADTDETRIRDENLRRAIVDSLYQIDAAAGERVDSFKVVAVESLSEKGYMALWMERIKLGMLFTERRLKMFDQELSGDRSKYSKPQMDSIKNARNSILGYYSLQQYQLDSCNTTLMYADTQKGYGQLAHIYRMFSSKKGVFLKGDGQYLVTRDMKAEPYYEHYDTVRLVNDFILESRRYMRIEVAD